MTVNDRNQTETPLKHHWGARFKAAREAMHLTEKEAGARLHLKPYLIAIIESERFENGPPAIFMRGYIRSYGRLLNLPEKEITQALAQLNLAAPPTAAPISTIQTQSIQYGNNVGWSTSLVVIVLVGLVGMWWHTHTRTNPKETLTTVSVQTAQPSTLATNTPGTPADPTPNELVNPQTLPNTTTPTMTTAAAPTTNTVAGSPNTPSTQTTAQQPAAIAAAINPQQAPAATNPQLPQASTPTVATNPQQPDIATTQTTAPQPLKPATEAQNTVTDNPAKPDNTDDKAAVATNDDNDAEEKPVKKHRERTRTPDVASSEMATPEQGLDTSDDNYNN